MMERFNKTRIAPTPSGYLHLGNVLSFAITAGLARRSGASVLLRIDDLDRERVNREYIADIFDTLNYLGIPWDEGPRNVDDFERGWSQVHRLEMYREALVRLREREKVFACDCSRSKILRQSLAGVYPGTCREKGISLESLGCCWRVRTDGGGLPAEMADFVVRKKDGYPAYQLTSVIDDLHFGVDVVVRGDDLRASTAAQGWLAAQLGLDEFKGVRFYHHGLLMAADNQKLSKSAGATSVQYLRRRGVQPAEIFSMILREMGINVAAASWEELAEAAGYLT